MATVDNDGSVDGDPCHECDGRLVLRNVPNGGFILGCSHYAVKQCTFTMAPNSEAIEKLLEERAERKRVRREKREAKLAVERAEAVEKRRQAEFKKPAYCVNCFMQLTTSQKQRGVTACC